MRPVPPSESLYARVRAVPPPNVFPSTFRTADKRSRVSQPPPSPKVTAKAQVVPPEKVAGLTEQTVVPVTVSSPPVPPVLPKEN
jgi:hypothetical protein